MFMLEKCSRRKRTALESRIDNLDNSIANSIHCCTSFSFRWILFSQLRDHFLAEKWRIIDNNQKKRRINQRNTEREKERERERKREKERERERKRERERR